MKEGVVEGGIEEICGKVFRGSGGELEHPRGGKVHIVTKEGS